MIEKLMKLGFTNAAATFLAAEIAAGRQKFANIEFTTLDLRFVPKINAQHA